MDPKKLKPPFISDIEKPYHECLKEKLNLYIDFLKNSNFKKILDKEDLKCIKSVSDNIQDSIDEYLKGKSGESYKKIEETLREQYKDWQNITYKLDKEKFLIRIRSSFTNLHNRKELFHIPFTQRQLVAKQRYSIEGLPCLYLSATSYTAWLELNKPNFNELWASGFRPTYEIPVLDLSYTISKIEEDFQKNVANQEQTIDRLKIFPFILATSFRVKHPKDSFHEEYIISGKLLQWIVNNTIFKGIRFLSTKLESNDDNSHLWSSSNFVIPPSEYKVGEIHNKFLINSFITTKPQNWSVLVAYSNAGEVEAYSTDGRFEENTSEIGTKESINASSIDDLIFKKYTYTDFYNIDGYLRTLFKLDSIEK